MCLTKCLLFKVYFSFYVQTSNIDGLEYIPYTFLTSSSFIIVLRRCLHMSRLFYVFRCYEISTLLELSEKLTKHCS